MVKGASKGTGLIAALAGLHDNPLMRLVPERQRRISKTLIMAGLAVFGFCFLLSLICALFFKSKADYFHNGPVNGAVCELYLMLAFTISLSGLVWLSVELGNSLRSALSAFSHAELTSLEGRLDSALLFSGISGWDLLLPLVLRSMLPLLAPTLATAGGFALAVSMSPVLDYEYTPPDFTVQMLRIWFLISFLNGLGMLIGSLFGQLILVLGSLAVGRHFRSELEIGRTAGAIVMGSLLWFALCTIGTAARLSAFDFIGSGVAGNYVISPLDAFLHTAVITVSCCLVVAIISALAFRGVGGGRWLTVLLLLATPVLILGLTAASAYLQHLQYGSTPGQDAGGGMFYALTSAIYACSLFSPFVSMNGGLFSPFPAPETLNPFLKMNDEFWRWPLAFGFQILLIFWLSRQALFSSRSAGVES